MYGCFISDLDETMNDLYDDAWTVTDYHSVNHPMSINGHQILNQITIHCAPENVDIQVAFVDRADSIKYTIRGFKEFVEQLIDHCSDLISRSKDGSNLILGVDVEFEDGSDLETLTIVDSNKIK